MKWTLKLMVVLVSVVLVALAANAVAQTPTPEPTDRRTEGQSEETEKSERPHRSGPRAKRMGQGGCGPSEPGRKAERIVHSETKFRLEDGFGTRVLDVGEVTAVSGNQITIERADGETISATASDDTRVCRDGEPSSLGDIQPGDKAALMQREAEGEGQLKGVRAFSSQKS